MKNAEVEDLKKELERLNGSMTRNQRKMVIIENTEFHESHKIVFVEIWACSADLEVQGWRARTVLVHPHGMRIAFEKL